MSIVLLSIGRTQQIDCDAPADALLRLESGVCLFYLQFPPEYGSIIL